MCEKVKGALKDGQAEAQLEHFELVTRLGKDMLLSGGEIFRTNEAMGYAAKALGLRDFTAYVIANGIFASTVADGKYFSTRICCVSLEPIMLCRVEAFNSLSRRISQGECSAEEIKEELRRVEHLEASGNRMKVLASGIGSASFCYLFRGSLTDSIAAFAAGVVLYMFLLYLIPRSGIPKIMVNILSSMLVTLVNCLLYRLGIGDNLNNMMIGAIFPLVPGIALTNSVRNFLENDYLSGMIRLVDALLTAGCIAVGTEVGLRMWNLLTGGGF